MMKWRKWGILFCFERILVKMEITSWLFSAGRGGYGEGRSVFY
jgi:hypothetical protein